MAEPESTILIVDDDADDLAAVERALGSLGSLGARILTVRDPHDVLPTVRRERPDVVVLDALLPGLSGFDLCKEIKTDADLRATQILIVTAVYLRQQYRHEALQQFKADAFLTKPFRPPELQRLVVQLLSRKTRKPQAKLLSRLGLPAKPAKRGLLGRLFGRGEEEAPADTRLLPPRQKRRPPEAPAPGEAALAEEESPETSSSPAPEPPRATESRSPEVIALPAPAPEPNEGAAASASPSDGVAGAPGVEPETPPETPAAASSAPPPAAEPSTESVLEDEAGKPAADEPRGELDSEERASPDAEKDDQEEAPMSVGEAASAETVSAGEAAAEPEPVPLAASDVPSDETATDTETVTAEAEVVEGALVEGEVVEARLLEAKDADTHTGAGPSAVVEAEPDGAGVEASELAEPGDAEAEVVEKNEASESDAAPASDSGAGDEPSEEEPPSAEVLEAPVPEAPPDGVSTAAGQSEASPLAAGDKESDEGYARPEPSKTLPEVELPEGLVAEAASAAPSEPDAPAEPESSPVATPAEATETAHEPAVAPTPGSAALAEPATTAPDASETTPAPERGESRPRRRPRRRLGEAPVFEEEEFGPELRRELSKCRRVDRPLTLILIQVEDLDQIVELFGKEFREDVLWHVADQAMVSLREVDVVGMISSKDRIAMTAFASDRYGGSRIVARMRRTVGKHPIRVGEELPPIVPALAFGMASYPEDAEDPESLLSRAEEELKGAKAHRED